MDRAIVEPDCAERLDVFRPDRGREVRQLASVVAERAQPGLEIRSAVVTLSLCGQLVWGALGTEVVGVRAPSVVALVLCGDNGGH